MKKINQTLAELMAGIVISSVVIWTLLLLFYGFRLLLTLCLFAGAAVAIGLSAHMYRSIDRALDMAPDDAAKYMKKAYMIRVLSIIAAGFLIVKISTQYIPVFFVGILCLKFGAFLQPLVHQMAEKLGQKKN